jgi:hypothetical protein
MKGPTVEHVHDEYALRYTGLVLSVATLVGALVMLVFLGAVLLWLWQIMQMENQRRKEENYLAHQLEDFKHQARKVAQRDLEMQDMSNNSGRNEIIRAKKSSNVDALTPDQGEPLPSGWTQHVDRSDGTVFYHNTVTGRTSWRHPSLIEKARIRRLSQIKILPPGWTEEHDADGKTFYYHEGDNKRTWAHPADGHEHDHDPTLPPNWEAHHNDDGTVFYENTQTGKTSWAHPAGLDEQLKEHYADLPEGWEPHHSEEGIFYHNEITGETRWDHPVTGHIAG